MASSVSNLNVCATARSCFDGAQYKRALSLFPFALSLSKEEQWRHNVQF